jgi:signal transduction histidine kinase
MPPFQDQDALGALLDALLACIERPSAAIAADGRMIAANPAFVDLSRRVARGWPVAAEALLAPSEHALFRALVSHAIAPESWRATFADGAARSFRVQTVPAIHASLVVIDDALGAPAAALNGEAELRHDVAGPLTAILGTAELMLMGGADLSPAARDGLTRIVQQCGRISDLLATSRAREASGRGGAA